MPTSPMARVLGVGGDCSFFVRGSVAEANDFDVGEAPLSIPTELALSTSLRKVKVEDSDSVRRRRRLRPENVR